MPTITSIGAAAARGFGFGTTQNPVPNIGPFILKAPTRVQGAALFDDGSLLTAVLAGGGIQTTVFSPGAHISSSSKVFPIGSSGDVNVQAVDAGVGTLGQSAGYVRQDSSQTVIIARTSVTNFGGGGTTGVASWYDAASGDTYLVSGLYAASGASTTQPVMRKMNSAGTVQWGKAYGSTLSPTGNTIVAVGITGNSSHIYLTVADFNSLDYRPRILKISKSNGTIVNAYVWDFKSSFFFPDVITAPTTDASGNLYFAVQNGVDVSPDVVGVTLLKYNSDMSTRLAAVTVRGTGFVYDGYGGGCAVDSITGNVYWVMPDGNSGATYLQTNSSLIPQLARNISGSGVRNVSSVTTLGNLYCYTKGDFVYALPINGSKTGVYTVDSDTITYSALPLPTYATSSRSMASTSYNDYTTAITNTTATPTTSTGVSINYVNL